MYADDYTPGVTQEDHQRVKKFLGLTEDVQLDPSIKNTLLNTKLSSIFPEGRKEIITVTTAEPASAAFHKIVQHGISSVVMMDRTSKRCVGFVGMTDMVALVFKECPVSEVVGTDDELTKILFSKNLFTHSTCEEVADLSRKNPFYQVEERASLQSAIDLMASWDVHRLPVVDHEGNLVTILTQSQVVSFLYNANVKIPFATKTVGELKLGYKNVISVKEDQMAAEGFKIIAEKRITGIAVLDFEDRLVTNLSASDLKAIGYTGKLLTLLITNVKQFKRNLPENPLIPGPISVSPATTVEEVILKIVLTKVHRVFVVDDQKKLLGVISLIDLIRLFTIASY